MRAPSLRIPALLLLLIFASASAQSYPSRVGAVATDSVRLAGAEIDRAASALADLGVDVVALYVEAPIGATLDDAERYFEGALARYGLAPDQSYLIVFVGTAELSADGVRPLFIEIGARLEDRLGDPGFADVLRSSVVAPRLLAGDPSGAFVAAFAAVEQALALQTGAESQPRPPSEPLPEPERPRFAWELVLVLILGASTLLWWRGRLRRGGASRSEEGAELQRVKGELSQLLIDLSGGGEASTSSLPSDPEEQTDFVLIRELLQATDPERVAGLELRYREATAQLQRVEAGFERLRSEEGVQGASATEQLARYRSLLDEAVSVAAFVEDLASQWGELQREAAAVPARLDSLRSRSAAMRAALVARFPETVDAEGALARVTTLFKRAVATVAVNGVAAAGLVDQAETDLGRIEAAVEQLSDAAEGLDDLDEDLSSWHEAGFDTEHWRRQHAALVGRVAGAVARVGYAVGGEGDVEAAADGARDLISEIETQVALQRRNLERLELLRRRGAATAERIEQGAVAFDAVDDFAEANWRDIRGNGSEAQLAAERAQTLVDRATVLNALARGAAPDEPAQDFVGAAAALDQAEMELAQAEALVTAIVERLATLREAQSTARRHLEVVEAELRAHRSLLATPEVDRAVGEIPAAVLAQGERRAAEARAVLEADRPDWLAALVAIQEADRLADEALAGLRQEREAMERRRLRLVSERDEALASRARSENFLRVHTSVLSPETLALGAAATDAYARAEALAARSDVADEATLPGLLDQAALAFDTAQTEADRVFAEAEREFAEVEALRRETSAAAAELEADVDSLRRYLRRQGLGGEFLQRLRDLERALPSVGRVGGPGLQGVARDIVALRSELGQVRSSAEQQAARKESALRRERQARVERERRRRAADRARQASSWGGSAVAAPRPAGSGSRSRIPTVSGAKRGTKSAPASPRRSGGSWGGAKRSKGGW